MYPVYLKIERPFIWDKTSDQGEKDAADRASAIGLTLHHAGWFEGDRKEATKKLKASGYDGTILIHSEGDTLPAHQEIVAFSPSQIKSAIGNRGTFSRKSAKITEGL